MTSNLPTVSSVMSAINDKDSKLAFELAAELSTIDDILERYDITKTELKKKLKNEGFSQMYKEFKGVWKSDLSVKERIRIKSMVLVEDSLLAVHEMVHNHDNSLGARMDAFKSLAKVATVDAPDKDQAAVGERINISINIPGAEKPITYEGEVIDGGKEIADSA